MTSRTPPANATKARARASSLRAPCWDASTQLRLAAREGDAAGLLKVARELSAPERQDPAIQSLGLNLACENPEATPALVAMMDELGWSPDASAPLGSLFSGARVAHYAHHNPAPILHGALFLRALAHGCWESAEALASRSATAASTPLHSTWTLVAIARGAQRRLDGAQRAAERAVEQGASPNAIVLELGCNALHVSALFSPSLLPVFLNLGADPNVLDDAGHTPLSLAAIDADADACLALMAAGADPLIGLCEIPGSAQAPRNLNAFHVFCHSIASRVLPMGSPMEMAIRYGPVFERFESAGLSFSGSQARMGLTHFETPRSLLANRERVEPGFLEAFEACRERLRIERYLPPAPARPPKAL